MIGDHEERGALALLEAFVGVRAILDGPVQAADKHLIRADVLFLNSRRGKVQIVA